MTVPTAEAWSFELLPPDRRQALGAGQSFETLAAAIALNHVVQRAWVEPYRDLRKGPAAQAIFRVAIDTDFFDQFFNGRDGLRARYWQAPEVGDQATRSLVDRLCGSLLSFPVEQISGRGAWTMARRDIEASLRAHSAKVWITERLGGMYLVDAHNPHRLIVPRWEESEMQSGSKGRSWRWTPESGTLEFKGALLTPDHKEEVPISKEDRAEQIFRYGWS